MLLRAARERVAGLAVEGVDDVLARLVMRHGVAARRRRGAPAAGTPRCGLTDDSSAGRWEQVVTDAPLGLTTAILAKRLRVAGRRSPGASRRAGRPRSSRRSTASAWWPRSQLLGNPAYRVDDVARLLGFTSLLALHRTARRAFGVPLREVAQLDGMPLAERLRGAPAGWR